MPLHNINAFYQFLDQMLKPIGDPEYQQRVWVKHEGSEVDGYDFTPMYFLERCDEIFKDSNRYEGVDSVIQEALKKLYDRIRQFNRAVACNIPEEREDQIIAHPEWIEIQKLAKQTYQTIINRLEGKKLWR
jgi:hypothetical protein